MIGASGGQTFPYVPGAYLSACPRRLLFVGVALPGLVVEVFRDALAVQLKRNPVEAMAASPVARKAARRVAVVQNIPAVSFSRPVGGEAVTVETAIGAKRETSSKASSPASASAAAKSLSTPVMSNTAFGTGMRRSLQLSALAVGIDAAPAIAFRSDAILRPRSLRLVSDDVVRRHHLEALEEKFGLRQKPFAWRDGGHAISLIAMTIPIFAHLTRKQLLHSVAPDRVSDERKELIRLLRVGAQRRKEHRAFGRQLNGGFAARGDEEMFGLATHNSLAHRDPSAMSQPSGSDSPTHRNGEGHGPK